MSVIFLNQSTVHYESLGRGRPVVFLHTWAGSWRYWVPSMQSASASHSAYAVDLFGFGDTAHGPLPYSLQQQAALVEGFLDEMGIGRIAIVGHGLGALVALSFAGRQPSRVARLMAIALPPDPMSVDDRLRSLNPAALLDLLGGQSAHPAGVLPPAASIDPRALDALLGEDQIRGAWAVLREAEIPCLLVYGSNDPLVPASSPEYGMALGPSVHQIVFGDSGHFPMLDEVDAFHRLLIDFLVLEPGAGTRGLRQKEEWRRRVR